MLINDIDMELPEPIRNHLRNFFEENMDFIRSIDLTNYINIDLFIKLYEEYLRKHSLMNNDYLMLFLYELNCSLVSLKITNGYRSGLNIKSANGDNIVFNDVIKKWYDASAVAYSVSQIDIMKLQSSVQRKIRTNVTERINSLHSARNVTFK